MWALRRNCATFAAVNRRASPASAGSASNTVALISAAATSVRIAEMLRIMPGTLGLAPSSRQTSSLDESSLAGI